MSLEVTILGQDTEVIRQGDGWYRHVLCHMYRDQRYNPEQGHAQLRIKMDH